MVEGEEAEAGSAWLGPQETNCRDPWGSHVLHHLMPKGGFGQTWWGEGLAAGDL